MNWKDLGRITVLILCLAVVPFLANSSYAQKPIELSFALHTAPGGPDHAAVDKFKEMIESRSKGRIKVPIFPGGQLGGERENLEQLRQGEVALTQFGETVVLVNAPEYSPFAVPFVFPNVDTVFKFLGGPIGNQIKKVCLTKGKVHILGMQRRGSRMLTAKKEVKVPDDLKGVKMRLPDTAPEWIAVWKEMGVIPTAVAWPEVFGALQTGVVEAQENPLYLIYTTKLYEVQSHVMLTAHLHSLFYWTMSDKVLSSLPKDLKEMVLQTVDEAARYGDKLAKEQEEDFQKKLSAAGMKIVKVDTKPFVVKAQPAVDRIRQKWAPGVYEEVNKILSGK